jgi:histone deacetylase complex subunit SAP18
MEEKTPAGQPIIDREKVWQTHHVTADLTSSLTFSLQTAPFLIRAFVKVGSFHRLSQFQDGPLPLTDELQIFTW